jgi:hypothetical protein
MGLANSIDPVKLTQSNSKKWVVAGLLGGYGFQYEKSIKKLCFGR